MCVGGCSWVRSSVFAAAGSRTTITSPHLSDAIGRGSEKIDSPDIVTAAAEADANLRRWITTGRAPRRAHLVGWLLQRLEIVRVAVAEEGESDGASEDQRQGRFHGEKSSERWSLVISKYSVSADSSPLDHAGSAENKAGRQQGACDEGKNKEVNTGPPQHARTFPGAAASSAIAMPRVVARDLSEGGGRGEGGDGEEHQWQWWDNENPWSRASRSSTKGSKSSPDGSLSGSGPPPPAYQETTPPPPYHDVVAAISAPRSSAQKTAFGRDQTGQTPETAAANRNVLLLDSVLSNGASSSGDDTSRGAPPSYRTAAAKGAGIPSTSQGEEHQQLLLKDLPPPSYGRFYGEGHRATVASLPRRETNSGRENSIASPDTAEWWAGDNNHLDYQRQQTRPKTGRDRERERVRKRDYGSRRRRHVSTDGGSYDGLEAFHGKTVQRPETAAVGDNDDDEEEDLLGGAWGWRSRYGGGGRRGSPTATGGRSRPRTTLPLPREKKGRKDTNFR